jgi:hypothetical protein
LTDIYRYRRLQWLIVAAVLTALLAIGFVLIAAIHESRARAADRREQQHAIRVQQQALEIQVKHNETAVIALCAQRRDLDQRITATENLLKKHRGQKFIFRIPRSLIKSGLARDQKTRSNLEILDCSS